MTQTTQYPEWQKAIREAQAIYEKERQEAAQAITEETRQRELKEGEMLREALFYLGINAPTLEHNNYKVDGFSFWLVPPGSFETELLKNDNGRIRFTIAVGHDAPNEDSDPEFSFGVRSETMRVDYRPSDDWAYHRDRLARTIDEVSESYRFALKLWQDSQESVVVTKSAPTLEQRLANLIREIVREELDDIRYNA